VLFGIGAGVGGSYFNFVYEGYDPTLSISMIGRYKAKYGELMRRTLARLGLKPVLKMTKRETSAFKHVKAGLANGQPMMVQFVGAPSYLPLQGYERFAEHAIVIYGVDEEAGTAAVADLAHAPQQIGLDALAAERAIYTPLKNLSLTVAPGEVDLVKAVETGLHETVTHMLNPPTPKGNFGINALGKWADLLADRKGKKGWTQVFTREHLYQALVGVFAQIELMCVGGGGMRLLYADFLDEASGILKNPTLTDVATQYRQAAAQWTAVAEAALPDHVLAFKETKALMRQKQAAFVRGDGVVALAAINDRQTAVSETMATDFPLTDADINELLDNLSSEVRKLHTLEKAAIEALQAGINN
ncbi:MAG: BtrH N-terminal domain-containing protein, partial [Chloroflexi bacterium]|nr:BtrH N-terminal domain-containing protein [Chloroflexota bacterium]